MAPSSTPPKPRLLMPSILGRFRRRVSFLVGARTMGKPMEGFLARGVGATILNREWDKAKLGTGTISIFDPKKSRAIRGRGTRFDIEAQPGDRIMCVVGKRHILRGTIAEICGPEKLLLTQTLLADKGTPEQLAPDCLSDLRYSWVSGACSQSPWEEIITALRTTRAVSLFPEGTCHDQPYLLPLKTGFGVIALKYAAAYPEERIIEMAVELARPSSMQDTCRLKRRILLLHAEAKSSHDLRRLFERIGQYRADLTILGLENSSVRRIGLLHACMVLLVRLLQLSLAVPLLFPGLLLFSPLLSASSTLAHRHSKRATATSAFRLRGYDVLASAKALSALRVAPLLYGAFAAGMYGWLWWSSWGAGVGAPASVGVVHGTKLKILAAPMCCYETLSTGTQEKRCRVSPAEINALASAQLDELDTEEVVRGVVMN
ncbi:hypothetical protein DL767_002115 [Monosporascus sp. MG133]|nr:hypothetical protein DL767_002115 [Monosporascus sp. MG133]